MLCHRRQSQLEDGHSGGAAKHMLYILPYVHTPRPRPIFQFNIQNKLGLLCICYAYAGKMVIVQQHRHVRNSGQC